MSAKMKYGKMLSSKQPPAISSSFHSSAYRLIFLPFGRKTTHSWEPLGKIGLAPKDERMGGEEKENY